MSSGSRMWVLAEGDSFTPNNQAQVSQSQEIQSLKNEVNQLKTEILKLLEQSGKYQDEAIFYKKKLILLHEKVSNEYHPDELNISYLRIARF